MATLTSSSGWSRLALNGSILALVLLPVAVLGFRLSLWGFDTSALLLLISFGLGVTITDRSHRGDDQIP